MLSEKASENFRVSGLSHVVAASGYNVTVIAGWVIALSTRFAGKKRAIYLGIVCIILYVLLAGAQAAVVRAGIMACIALVGLALGRKSEAIWIWLLTGIDMVIVSPEYMEDVGWQLSMAATGSLLVLVRGKTESLLKTDLQTTLAAQAGTLPILLHYFGSMSVEAPVTNILALWTVPMIMQVIALAVVVGLVWKGLGMWIAWISWPLLPWMTEVVELAAKFGWSSVQVGSIGWGWVTIYYLVLGLYVRLRK